MDTQDRRKFLTRAGTVTGAAAFVGVPGLGGISERPAEHVEAPSALTKDPVLVYVRDAARGEVTVMHGSRETTYRDRALVKRLLKAAAATSETAAWEVK
ncbi:MAG: twin-arginine translocation signal domain-containing protein [Gaiellales bacterium]